jgi:hypothetical protein
MRQPRHARRHEFRGVHARARHGGRHAGGQQQAVGDDALRHPQRAVHELGDESDEDEEEEMSVEH